MIALLLGRSMPLDCLRIWIESFSTTGVSGLNGNLAERIVSASDKINGMLKGEYVTLDSLYKDSVKEISDSLKDFSNTIEPSIKTFQDAGGALSDAFVEEHTDHEEKEPETEIWIDRSMLKKP